MTVAKFPISMGFDIASEAVNDFLIFHKAQRVYRVIFTGLRNPVVAAVVASLCGGTFLSRGPLIDTSIFIILEEIVGVFGQALLVVSPYPVLVGRLTVLVVCVAPDVNPTIYFIARFGDGLR